MKKHKHIFLVGALFVIITIVFFYPLSIQFRTHINDNFDSMFMMWLVSWYKYILQVDPLNFLNGNLLYPDKMTMAYSTFWFTKIPIFLFFDLFFKNTLASLNLTIFFSFWLAAVGFYSLMCYYTKNKLASFISAFLYAFSPIAAGKLPLAQLLDFEFFPFAVLFLEKYFAGKCNKYVVLFALFSLLQILSEGYVAFIFVTGMAIFVTLRFRRKIFDKRFLLALGVVAAIACIFYSPYIYMLKTKPEIYKKELVWSINMSNNLKSFYSLPSGSGPNILKRFLPIGSIGQDSSAYLGVLPVCLAFISLFMKKIRDKYIWYLIFLLYVFLSFGPYLILSDGRPIKLLYYYFWKFIPGFSIMRVSSRFIMGAVFAISLISGLVIARLLTSAKTKLLKVIVVAILLSTIVADNIFIPFHSEPLVKIPKIYYFLKTQKRGGVFEFPFHTNADFFIDKATYFSTADFFPRVMAYSSSYSETFHYFKFLERTELLYSILLTNKLKEIRVPYVIVHKDTFPKVDSERFIKLIKKSGYKEIKEINNKALFLNKKNL